MDTIIAALGTGDSASKLLDKMGGTGKGTDWKLAPDALKIVKRADEIGGKKDAKEDAKESAGSTRESAYRQKIRAEMNETRNMRSRSGAGIKAQAKAELRESANGRPGLADRVAARKRRMILEATDPAFAASSLSAADSREEAGRSIMESRGGKLPEARTWSGREDVSESSDRSDYFRSGGPEAGRSGLHESESADEARLMEGESPASRARRKARDLIRRKGFSWDEVGHLVMNQHPVTGNWTVGSGGQFVFSTREEAAAFQDAMIHYRPANESKSGVMEGAVKRAWLDGSKFIANGGASSWVMTEVAQRKEDGKWIVREGEDPSIDRNSGGLLPLGHVHAVYETRKEADAYCAALREGSTVDN